MMTLRPCHDRPDSAIHFMQAVVEANLGSLLGHSVNPDIIQEGLQYGTLDLRAFYGGEDTKSSLA